MSDAKPTTYSMDYYQKHKGEILKRKRRRYADHAEFAAARKAYQKEYYQRNRDRLNAMHKEYSRRDDHVKPVKRSEVANVSDILSSSGGRLERLITKILHGQVTLHVEIDRTQG